MVEHCYFLTWAEIKSLILVWITKWSGLSVISGISFTEKKHYIFPCTTTKTPTGIWSGLQTLCKQGARRQSHFLTHTYCFMHSKLLDVNKKETYWIHIAVHIVVILRGRVCKLKKGNLARVRSQSHCSERRPSAVSLCWRKRTWLRAEISLRQRRGACGVALCTVSGPAARNFSFLSLVASTCPAHTRTKIYQLYLGNCVDVKKKLKESLFPFLYPECNYCF